MKFEPDHDKKISITLINKRLSFYAQPEYDIKIRVKINGTNEVKAITLPDYVTKTPKFRATTEAANLITNIAKTYIENDKPFLEKAALKVMSVLDPRDINYIESKTRLMLRR